MAHCPILGDSRHYLRINEKKVGLSTAELEEAGSLGSGLQASENQHWSLMMAQFLFSCYLLLVLFWILRPSSQPSKLQQASELHPNGVFLGHRMLDAQVLFSGAD